MDHASCTKYAAFTSRRFANKVVNVAPTDDVPVVGVNKQAERTGSRMHWGLIP
jgi:putative SOS response-associated peptidase YedK